MNGQDPNDTQQPFSIDENETDTGSSDVVSENERLLGGLSYASQVLIPGVLPVVLLVARETKDSRFLRFHAVQSLALLVATVIYYLVAIAANVVVGALASCLVCILWLAFLLPIPVLAYYAVLAFQGKQPEVPFLTKFLRDNGWL